MLFSNNTNDVIREAFFSFPLPSSCSLTKFQFHIGDDRVINGNVKPIRKAKVDFNGAIHNRKTAALIKQETAEIFTATLGNLPPNTMLRAEVSMVMMLKEKIPDRLPTRISTLCIPTYIAPRYGKPPMPHLQDTISRPDVQHELSITLEAIFADEVIDVTSMTHEISYQCFSGPRPTDSWDVFVHGDSLSREPSNIVTVEPKEPFCISTPHAYLEHHPTLHDHQALMVTIPSNILVVNRPNINESESEVLFLADLSGPMFNKRSSLKSAIKFFLNGLPVNRHFNIWSFGTSYSSLWPQSKANSQRSLRQALDHIESEVEKNLGGTELLPALKTILDSRSLNGPSMTTDILLLTDGEVWREEETIEFVSSAREHSGYRVRFFCLGIGDAVSHSLVEGVAKAGGGYSEVVPAKSLTVWEHRVVLMLKAALHMHVGPVKLDTGQETQGGFRPWADESFLRSPTDISILSPFVTNKVLMLFESTRLPINEATIRLTTKDSCGREQVCKIKPNPFHSEDPLIHQLAARELLRDLEHDRHWLIHPNEESLRREVERIACKFSLVSKWTCLVAVEEPQPKAQPDTLSDLVLDNTSSQSWTKLVEWIPDLLKTHPWSKGNACAPKEAHQMENSAIIGSTERDDLPFDASPGQLKQGIELRVSPNIILNDRKLDTQYDTVERPCWIKRLAAATKTSIPTLPALALNLPRGVKDEDEEEDLNKRGLIQDLVRFQSFGGSFSNMPDTKQNLVEMFGGEIGPVLDNVSESIYALLPRMGTRSERRFLDVAVAVIITTLLRKRFVSCQVLWSRVGDNAESFVRDCLTEQHSSVRLKDLFRVAEDAIRGMKMRIKRRQNTYPPIPSTSVGRHGHSSSQKKNHPAPIHNARKPMSSTPSQEPTRSYSGVSPSGSSNAVLPTYLDSKRTQTSRRNGLDSQPQTYSSSAVDTYIQPHHTQSPESREAPRDNSDETQQALYYSFLRQPRYEGQTGQTHEEREVEQMLRGMRSYSRG
ncbi:vWA [Fusarium agapanthi]|uniref:VWA n=1 Tax=Fusarium agapanthi TaxID=1803897 RepID=A0A9P5B399_9HYPO|nr:vWA [Fusarium agapanthi]